MRSDGLKPQVETHILLVEGSATFFLRGQTGGTWVTPIKTSGAKNDCLFNAVNETLEALGYEPVSRTEIMDYMIDHLDMDLDVGTETLTFRRWFEDELRFEQVRGLEAHCSLPPKAWTSGPLPCCSEFRVSAAFVLPWLAGVGLIEVEAAQDLRRVYSAHESRPHDRRARDRCSDEVPQHRLAIMT